MTSPSLSATLSPMAAAISVALVEDNRALAEALQVLLEGTPGFRFVSAHPDTEDAVATLTRKHVDVVLVDISLPGASGVECVRRLRRLRPNMNILMFTVNEDTNRLFEALTAGANGYLLKSTPPADILVAIQDVAAGGAPMTPSIARRVLQHFHQPRKAKDEVETLSTRESEILHQLSQGHTAKEIATALHLSPDTVRNHIKSIYAKLQVHNRAQAVGKYLGH